MGLIRELLIDGVVGKALGGFEDLKKRYPLKKARLHSALFVSVLVTLPLMALIGSVHLCMLVWDIFEPFSVGLPLYLHLIPIFLHAGALVFSVLLVMQLWSVLKLLYSPLDELVEQGVSELLGPVRGWLLRMDLTVLSMFIVIFAAVTAHGLFTSYTGFHLGLMVLTMIISGLLVALSVAVYLIIKGLFLLLFNKLLKRLDEKFGISKRLKKFYGPIKGNAAQ